MNDSIGWTGIVHINKRLALSCFAVFCFSISVNLAHGQETQQNIIQNLRGQIAKNGVFKLHDGANNVQFSGVQKTYKNLFYSQRETSSFVTERAMILKEWAGFEGTSNYQMYFCISGENEQDAVYYPDLQVFFLTNSFEGKEAPITSVSFFNANISGHTQTFLAYARRIGISIQPSKTEVMIFRFMPGIMRAGQKGFPSDPYFEKIVDYFTSYVSSSSDSVLERELSVPPP